MNENPYVLIPDPGHVRTLIPDPAGALAAALALTGAVAGISFGMAVG